MKRRGKLRITQNGHYVKTISDYASTVWSQSKDSPQADLMRAGRCLPGSLNTVPNVLFLPGGATIRSGKDVLGGIGVSGAPGGEKDEACALAALAKYKARIE
jgi:uncharacterized protein GlcG (DUF336 family)